MKIFRAIVVASAALLAEPALAQQAGTVSLNAFAVGNGPSATGFKSLICTGFAVGTGAGAAPTCRVIASSDIPASVALTGTPTAPTAAADTNTTQLATTAFVIGQASAVLPIIDGTAAIGSSLRYARADHVHPTDTTRAPTTRLISTTAPLTGGGDLSTDRTHSISANGITNALLRQSLALALVGNATNATANVADIQATAASSCVFRESASTLVCSTLAPASIAAGSASHAIPVDVAGALAWKVIPDCQDISGNHVNYTQSTDAFSCGNTGGGGGSTTIIPPQGRLTLTSGAPVMTADATAQATLYYDSYNGGNQVPYYNGTGDALDTIAAGEVSDAMVSAASAGQVVSNNLYDVWWVHGGTNRICLAMSASTGGGGGWSSDTAGTNTARGTGYSQIDRTTRQYITNKNSITNCFNAATNYGPVSANQGTYLGTVYATANGQSGMQFKPTAASGGTNNILGVYNAYNWVRAESVSQDSVTSYTYNSVTWRHMNASTSNRIRFIDGLGQSQLYGRSSIAMVPNASGGGGSIGTAIDWASGAPNNVGGAFGTSNSFQLTVNSGEPFAAVVGLHELDGVEAAATTTATSFFGSGFGAPTGQTQSITLTINN